jgi:hypothetical protein
MQGTLQRQLNPASVVFKPRPLSRGERRHEIQSLSASAENFGAIDGL